LSKTPSWDAEFPGISLDGFARGNVSPAEVRKQDGCHEESRGKRRSSLDVMLQQLQGYRSNTVSLVVRVGENLDV